MKQGFEDAFTDIQSDYISLCLELCGSAADEVNVLIYQDRHGCAFNAFFRRNRRIITTSDLADDELAERFLELGTDDIDKLIRCCEEYGHPCPNLMKLTYDILSGHFDAHYEYDPVLETGDVSFEDLFRGWIREKHQS